MPGTLVVDLQNGLVGTVVAVAPAFAVGHDHVEEEGQDDGQRRQDAEEHQIVHAGQREDDEAAGQHDRGRQQRVPGPRQGIADGAPGVSGLAEAPVEDVHEVDRVIDRQAERRGEPKSADAKV